MTDVHTELATTCGWRLEPWPTDRSIAQIIFTDMLSVPSEADFHRAVAQAAAAGARAVRTSALFPRSQGAAIGAGFDPIDTLSLLRLSLTEPDPVSPVRETRAASRLPPISRLRFSQLTSAAEVDRLSFGSEWANSTNSLRKIAFATDRARARVVRSDGRQRRTIDGFIVSGLTGPTGYLQRLAVHPEQRRRGIARALVIDGIEWMRRNGATTAFVNTGLENEAAHSLYRSFGFVDTGEVLTINERMLTNSNPNP